MEFILGLLVDDIYFWTTTAQTHPVLLSHPLAVSLCAAVPPSPVCEHSRATAPRAAGEFGAAEKLKVLLRRGCATGLLAH